MTNDELRRESVIKEVITIFIDVINFLDDDEKLSVNEQTDITKDFKVCGDEDMEFIVVLEKHFKIDAGQKEWSKVSRIYEIADLIIKHLDQKP